MKTLTRRGFLAGMAGLLAAKTLPQVKLAPPTTAWKQLPPLRRIKSPTTVRWSQLVYGSAICYVPCKKVVFIEVL